jgi:hypothetical protein
MQRSVQRTPSGRDLAMNKLKSRSRKVLLILLVCIFGVFVRHFIYRDPLTNRDQELESLFMEGYIHDGENPMTPDNLEAEEAFNDILDQVVATPVEKEPPESRPPEEEEQEQVQEQDKEAPPQKNMDNHDIKVEDEGDEDGEDDAAWRKRRFYSCLNSGESYGAAWFGSRAAVMARTVAPGPREHMETAGSLGLKPNTRKK